VEIRADINKLIIIFIMVLEVKLMCGEVQLEVYYGGN